MPAHTTPDSRPRRTLLDRFWNLPMKTLGLIGLGILLLVVLFAFLLGWNHDPEADAAASPSSPSSVLAPAAPVDTETAAPQDAKTGVAVPDGPAPDQGPFGVDAQSLLQEVASHQVPLKPTDAQTLVDIANRAVARDVPDLDAADPQIRADLQAAFPGWTEQNYVDATRCAAEYAERVIARNDGTVPPDSDDHHGGN